MRLTDTLKSSALYVTTLLNSAVFWALVLTLGGAAGAAVGAGLLWGLGAGVLTGGAFAVLYGLIVLKGMVNNG